MSLAIINSRSQHGVASPSVMVEAHISGGLPKLSIVGLPETAVKESKDRVRGALLNSKFEFPVRRITINLAPADIPKEGSRFDLPIAIGILAASGQIPLNSLDKYEFIGELALSGELRPVRGVLPAAIQAREARRTLVIAKQNADEAALVEGLDIIAANHLIDICAHLNNLQIIDSYVSDRTTTELDYSEDLADVKGQHHAKRALEIAAAGSHSLLMMGPPGTGKTMLASRLPTILPDMSDDEALEAAAVASIGDSTFDVCTWKTRSFRSPHHTASAVALVGGGSIPRPGEISLAHNGVLFLDELPEFDRKVLEVLREPLESGKISISRAARQAEFPARFQLIAAMNPCPCGYQGHSSGRCQCTSEQIQKYRNRVSGPLLDRIDIHIVVPSVERAVFNQQTAGESSAQIKLRVINARNRQLDRRGKCNALLSNRELEQDCKMNSHMRALVEQAIDRFNMSARAYHRILKLARTIADLADEPVITTSHLLEAINYRTLDRQATTAIL